MSVLKKIVRKLKPITQEEMLDALRRDGAVIGKGVRVFEPKETFIDPSTPYRLTIGAYTKITKGVTILTHDYSLSVLRRKYGPWIGEGQETVIGENCFLGMGAVVLMGTHLGNNVIVGAGSVVHGTFPDDVVIAGNPAKIICTLEQHYENRKAKTRQEALDCARLFYQRLGRVPTPADLGGFKFLFTPRSKAAVEEYGLDFFCTGDEPAEVEQAFYDSQPEWENFDAFLQEAGLK